MSRSYKKVPIVKDKGDKTYNKRFRRANKVRINQGKEPYHRTSEIVNDYDVCDWIMDARLLYTPPRWLTEEEIEEEIIKAKRK
jgi:hypothetical protein